MRPPRFFEEYFGLRFCVRALLVCVFLWTLTVKRKPPCLANIGRFLADLALLAKFSRFLANLSRILAEC